MLLFNSLADGTWSNRHWFDFCFLCVRWVPVLIPLLICVLLLQVYKNALKWELLKFTEQRGYMYTYIAARHVEEPSREMLIFASLSFS